MNSLPIYARNVFAIETKDVVQFFIITPCYSAVVLKVHTGRESFDVACVQCGHSHSQQQVPFARVVPVRPVWIRPDIVCTGNVRHLLVVLCSSV